MACGIDECCVAELRCSGIAVVVFLFLLLCLVLYEGYRRRMVVLMVKEEHARQQAARDNFARQFAAGMDTLTTNVDEIRAAHRAAQSHPMGAVSEEIEVRPARRSTRKRTAR